MPFKKGESGNKDGKPKGKLNRTTEQAKALLEQILYGQIENIEDALANMKEKSDKDYVDACVKMFKYVLPEKRDLTSGGQTMTSINVTVDSNETAQELNRLINGSEAK